MNFLRFTLIKPCALGLALALGIFTGAQTSFAADIELTENAAPQPDASNKSLIRRYSDNAQELVMRALSLIGANYHRGGESPESGFDCSGLVRHVFREALGLKLPRTSRDISRLGTDVSNADLKPGDLVFFNTLRRGFSHVGIYLGDNRFVHAPASGGEVRVEDMRVNYWARRFNGARRIAGVETPDMRN